MNGQDSQQLHRTMLFVGLQVLRRNWRLGGGKPDTRLWFLPVLALLALMASCAAPWSPQPSPLPGWQTPVSGLLLDESAFPPGWQIDVPAGTAPTANHVAQVWWYPFGPYGGVDQQIWRAYTITEAEEKYARLRASQFQFSRPLYTDALYVPFEPPAEITFQSQAADEFYLACGCLDVAYCEVIARYRNYVVELRLDREAEYEGHVTRGLTYAEIEAIVRAMDAKFTAAMEAFYGAPGK